MAAASPSASLPRRAARRWRRLTLPLRTPRADFVYSPDYGYATSAVPADPLRAELILAFLFSEGLLAPAQVHCPSPATAEALRRVHTDDYLESLSLPGTLTRVVGVEVPLHQQDRLLALQRSMVGGTLHATRLALTTGRPAVNLAGGLHHARADRGQGFCLLNDVAVAIAEERARGLAGPVLVIDLDLHDGDGTRSLFAADPTVHTFSISNHLWGDPDAVASTTVTLGDDVGDEAYLTALARELPPVIESTRPRLVFFLAGCDPAAGDHIGNWLISAAGMVERDRFVVRQLHRLAPHAALVVLLAGGYGRGAWRHSARSFSNLLLGRPLEPPTTHEMTLARYRHLSEILRASGLVGDAGGDDWGLDEADLLGNLGASARPNRFLAYYSQHQLEIILERSGLFARLRGMGFPRPTLELQLDNPTGHTLRVFADERREDLLAELRVLRDRAALPGMEMLRIEWLLLQNPRALFTDHRPQLPGQRHPGLGMLRDVMAMLVVVCERLHLDGILFVPSHYHLSAQAKSVLAFVDPHHEGRFRAVTAALASLDLAAAGRALAQGRVRYRTTGEPFRWQPAAMVLPVSEPLRERSKSESYEETAQREAQRHDLVLES